MFDNKQLEILNQELASTRIKSRSKGSINLSYLEGFDILDTANKVFGFGNWNYSISNLESVSQEFNQNQNTVICYKATVQVLVHNENHLLTVNREDVGFGTGIAKTLAEAHEGAAKEAITDALKRAMRSFGNQFGNSLYNKARNSGNTQSYQPSANNNQQQNYQPQINNQNQQNCPPQNQTRPQNTQIMNNPNQSNQKQTSYDQFEYQSLFNIGLDVVENKGFLIVMGDDIYAKKDSIKACGFRFDPKTKSWYKQINQQGAA